MRFAPWVRSGYRSAAPYVLIFLWSAWIELIVEFLSRGRVGETLTWVCTRWPVFIASNLMVACLLVLLIAMSRRPRLAYWSLSLPLLSLAAASGIKMRILGTPLLPQDLMLAGEAGQVADPRDLISLPALGGLGLFLLVSLGMRRRIPAPKALQKGRARLLAVGVSLAAMALLASVTPRVADMWWDPGENVRQNGLLIAELQSVQEFRESEAAMAALEPFSPSDGEGGPVRPNIVLVLSESFWDPTLLPNAAFSTDPLPFFHSLQPRFPGGWMTTPEYGGRTANVEWEVLTGLSMQFLPQGTLPYNKYMERPVDSLASVLTRQGYAATAISPWAHGFFNSDQAYRAMGFGRFISIEFMRWDLSGPNIADREVARIIAERTAATPGPDFVFANTGENHYPYPADKFGGNQVQVTGLSPGAAETLGTYAQGVRAADNMLRQLVEHYSAQAEPTMIIYFGDHLPVLGTDYQVYREGGWITGRDDPAYYERMYRTPFLVWSNFGSAGPEQVDLGANFLHAYILQATGRTPGPAAWVLGRLPGQIRSIPVRDRWGEVGIAEGDLAEYMALERDVLSGSQRTYEKIREKIINPDFVLGYGPMELDQAVLSGGAEPLLTVSGRNLPPRAQLIVGDQVFAATGTGPDQLQAIVPSALLQGGRLEVEVQVTDREGRVIARSNRMMLSMTGP